jgi:uncharacterized protein
MQVTKNESNWAMMAHLSSLINLVTGFLGPVVAIIIYFSYRDQSKYVANQALQSFIFQIIFVIFGEILVAIAWTITGILSVIVIGICLIPFAIILSIIPLAAIFYSIYAAIQASSGLPFKYPLIGNWVD